MALQLLGLGRCYQSPSPQRPKLANDDVATHHAAQLPNSFNSRSPSGIICGIFQHQTVSNHGMAVSQPGLVSIAGKRQTEDKSRASAAGASADRSQICGTGPPGPCGPPGMF
jgi:hypothetical protein